jgi:hypothetical protein
VDPSWIEIFDEIESMNLSAFQPSGKVSPSAPVILTSGWLVGSASATAANAKRQTEVAKVVIFLKQGFCGVFIGFWSIGVW